MKLVPGKKYLVTTDSWFMAPDGEQYKAVFGTLMGVFEDTQVLGVAKTNRNSTNWYVEIGNMIVAGCIVHFAIQSDNCSTNPPTKDLEHDGAIYSVKEAISRIYMADQDDLE